MLYQQPLNCHSILYFYWFSFSLHSSSRFLATTSGQRHFFLNSTEDSDDDTIVKESSNQFIYDNSLKIWRL